MKIKKGDLIRVMVGRDRGREVKIERVFPKKGTVLAIGVNQYKKHRKPAQDKSGEVVTLDRPLDVSKVALVCPKCKQITRVGYKIIDTKKIRICRKCDQDVDVKQIQNPKSPNSAKATSDKQNLRVKTKSKK